jgi:hypothetical protein
MIARDISNDSLNTADWMPVCTDEFKGHMSLFNDKFWSNEGIIGMTQTIHVTIAMKYIITEACSDSDIVVDDLKNRNLKI